jgi:hypothetical protein
VIPKRILDQAKENIEKEDKLFKQVRSDLKYVECGGNDVIGSEQEPSSLV